MRKNNTTIFPKHLFASIRHDRPQIRVSQAVIESAALDVNSVYQRFATRSSGLSAAEAESCLSGVCFLQAVLSLEATSAAKSQGIVDEQQAAFIHKLYNMFFERYAG